MIRLFEKLKETEPHLRNGMPGTARPTNSVSPAQLRVTKDINDFRLEPTMKVKFPDPNNLLTMEVAITPQDGLYKGGSFRFSIDVTQQYPYEPPKVKCIPLIYHPNINYDGKVCLNILREDWKPVLSLSSVIYGLGYLFSNPNASDPLNHEAAKWMLENPQRFTRMVTDSMKGRIYVPDDEKLQGRMFDKVWIEK